MDEAALATTVDATEGLEQDIEQLLQSAAHELIQMQTRITTIQIW